VVRYPPQPQWLANKLAISRRQAKPTNCNRCGAQTLTGDDHDQVAAQVTVDPTPVDHLTEIVAILTGSYSYDLIAGALHYRNPHDHARHPSPHPVLLRHTCTP